MQSEKILIDQGKRSFIETARRAQIVECAIETIADLGFAQASLAQIAKRAKVSTGVILYYFNGKDDLIREVVAHVFATGEAFMRPRVDVNQDSARKALLSFIAASVDFIASNPTNVRAVMNIMRAGRTENGALRFDPAVEEPRRAGFRNILQWGHRTGEFRAFDVRVMVVTIIEALDVIPSLLAAEPDIDLAAYKRNLVELFDRATRNDGVDPTLSWESS
ncbi:MAG: TetR family transcriptional regulator [Alphaproteobacteria bacterium]|nr:TetR family transcriptional regulator [Alphaproteobacteria bacterium]